MSVLVAMAHFDVARKLRPHTEATIRNYADCAERVVVVSTSGIGDDDLAALPDNVDFITRPNYGYDFFSYKWALDIVGDYAAYDRLVLVNDTFVGPIISLQEILQSDQAHRHDMMGMTWSENHGGHAQSFFVVVSNVVLRSNSFQRFWRAMVPVSERKSVIMQYEVGLTLSATSSGFTAGGYLEPTDDEQHLAQQRRRHQDEVRIVPASGGKVIRDARPATKEQLRAFNPAIALADRLLLDRRLPLLKFDTLRFDPYGLGAARLLSNAEAAFPEHLSGVREFLEETKPAYAFRAREHNGLSDPITLESSGLGYCMDAAFLQSAAPREVYK